LTLLPFLRKKENIIIAFRGLDEEVEMLSMRNIRVEKKGFSNPKGLDVIN